MREHMHGRQRLFSHARDREEVCCTAPPRDGDLCTVKPIDPIVGLVATLANIHTCEPGRNVDTARTQQFSVRGCEGRTIAFPELVPVLQCTVAVPWLLMCS